MCSCSFDSIRVQPALCPLPSRHAHRSGGAWRHTHRGPRPGAPDPRLIAGLALPDPRRYGAPTSYRVESARGHQDTADRCAVRLATAPLLHTALRDTRREDRAKRDEERRREGQQKTLREPLAGPPRGSDHVGSAGAIGSRPAGALSGSQLHPYCIPTCVTLVVKTVSGTTRSAQVGGNSRPREEQQQSRPRERSREAIKKRTSTATSTPRGGRRRHPERPGTRRGGSVNEVRSADEKRSPRTPPSRPPCEAHPWGARIGRKPADGGTSRLASAPQRHLTPRDTGGEERASERRNYTRGAPEHALGAPRRSRPPERSRERSRGAPARPHAGSEMVLSCTPNSLTLIVTTVLRQDQGVRT